MSSRDEPETGNRTRLVAVVAGVVFGVAVVFAIIFLLWRVSEVSWKEYVSESHGFVTSYPGDWQVVTAAPRDKWDMVWDDPAEDLTGDEIEKVTFRERHFAKWGGQFQVDVLEDSSGLGLEEWVKSRMDESKAGANLLREVRDTMLLGSRAKKVIESAFGYENVELITSADGWIYTLSYVGASPNDPKSEWHRDIYDRMVSTFRTLE